MSLFRRRVLSRQASRSHEKCLGKNHEQKHTSPMPSEIRRMKHIHDYVATHETPSCNGSASNNIVTHNIKNEASLDYEHELGVPVATGTFAWHDALHSRTIHEHIPVRNSLRNHSRALSRARNDVTRYSITGSNFPRPFRVRGACETLFRTLGEMINRLSSLGAPARNIDAMTDAGVWSPARPKATAFWPGRHPILAVKFDFLARTPSAGVAGEFPDLSHRQTGQPPCLRSRRAAMSLS